MPQLTIFGKTTEQMEAERRQERQRWFWSDEIKRLKQIKERIVKGEYVDWWLGEWWYCNEIKGWAKIEDFISPQLMEYDGVPNEYLRELRSVNEYSLDRHNIVWNKQYALKRLNQAIGAYENMLNSKK